MSAADRNFDPRSPKSSDGLMAKFVKKLFLRDGHVASVETLAEHFVLVGLKGEGLRNVKWTPGDKIQIVMGGGFSNRTYTPISWEADAGQTQVLAYLHGDTPGCQWARNARQREAIQFLGPRESLDLPHIAASAVLFGDETSFGLAAALRQTAGGKTACCVFEVAELVEAAKVLATIGISDAKLIARAPDASHFVSVHTELLRAAASDTQFVLTGKAASIQSVKKALTAEGIGNTRMKSKAYWAPGKVGLD